MGYPNSTMPLRTRIFGVEKEKHAEVLNLNWKLSIQIIKYSI